MTTSNSISVKPRRGLSLAMGVLVSMPNHSCVGRWRIIR
jgi:hypothetical protein